MNATHICTFKDKKAAWLQTMKSNKISSLKKMPPMFQRKHKRSLKLSYEKRAVLNLMYTSERKYLLFNSCCIYEITIYLNCSCLGIFISNIQFGIIIFCRNYAAFSGWLITVVICLSAILMQASRNGNDLWLSFWVDTTTGSSQTEYSTSFYLVFSFSSFQYKQQVVLGSICLLSMWMYFTDAQTICYILSLSILSRS